MTGMKPVSVARIFVALLALLLTLPGAFGQTNAPAAVTHLKAPEAAKLVEKGGVTVLDLRTPGEFSTTHIAGAKNLDCMAADFATQLEKLDRNQTYLIHCASGRRSTNALPQFDKLGFKHVVHLDGGLRAWEAGKNPVTKN